MAMYIVTNLENANIKYTMVQAQNSSMALQGFNAVHCGRTAVSHIKELKLRSRDDLESLSLMDRDIIGESLKDYVYFNPIGGYWLRDMDRTEKRFNVLELLPDSKSRTLGLFFIDLPYTSEDNARVANYIGNLRRVKSSQISYAPYNERDKSGELNFTPAVMACGGYDESAFVLFEPSVDLVREILLTFTHEAKKPSIYIINREGRMETV